MNPVYINNIAIALPNLPIGNDEMEAVLGQIGDKPSRARKTVLRSNGITTRYYAIDPATGRRTHSNAQLTAQAIRNLAGSTLDLHTLDCLACGTSVPDQLLPNHAVMVQGEIPEACCEVVATAGVCIAGMSALKYAQLGVASGDFSNAIATGSEVISGLLRPALFKKEFENRVDELGRHPEIAFEKDFLRWMLSDGAGAVLLQPRPAPSGLCLRIEWIFQRSYANEMEVCMYSGARKTDAGTLVSWQDSTPDSWLDDSLFTIRQDVKLLNANIVRMTVENPLLEIQEKYGIKPEDIDFFLPHYSSEYFRQKLYDGMQRVNFEIPFDRWFTNLTSVGNTGAASVYLMLEQLYRSGRLKQGHRLLCYVPESGRFSAAYMLLTVCSSAG